MRPLIITSTVALAGFLVAGCATHPLGKDWGQLDPDAREARIKKTLTGLITGGISGDGESFEDRKVISCDLKQVVYEPRDGVGPVSSLRWADVRSVTGQPETTLPSRPETLFLYLVDDSPSTKSVRDLTQPVLSKVGLVNSYLLLRNRPRRSRVALIRCLDYLRKRQLKALTKTPKGKTPKRTSPKPEPDPTPATPDPTPATPDPTPAKPDPEPDPKPTKPKTTLDAVEAKLKKLKAWKDQGLITEQEYETKKAELLKGL